jgi:multidrug efflux system membrane fusion protein
MLIRTILANKIRGMLGPASITGRATIVFCGSVGALCVACGAASLLTFNQVTAEPTPKDLSYPAVAKPWRDVNLSFSRPGRVVKILVRRGQIVKKGQVLAEENDRQQKIAAQLADLAGHSTLRIQAAQAELAQDAVSLKRTQWAAGQHAATPFEVRRAELKVTIDTLSLKLAELKHQHDLLAWKAAQLAVQRRKITAPFAGIIENRFIDAGRTVDAFKKVLEIVQVNRLRIFVPVPLVAAEALRTGLTAEISMAAGQRADGIIIWRATVADSASNTVLVEIQVGNPRLMPAGQQVRVTFLPPTPAANSKAGERGQHISGRQATAGRPIGGAER